MLTQQIHKITASEREFKILLSRLGSIRHKMRFKQLFQTTLLIVAAALSFADIVSDMMLVHKYYLHPVLEQVRCDFLIRRRTDMACLKVYMRLTSCVFFRQEAFIFYKLTFAWIAAGGVAQFVIVIRCIWKKRTCLDLFPGPLRILLILSAIFLLAPALTNVVAAYVVIRNRPNVEEELIK